MNKHFIPMNIIINSIQLLLRATSKWIYLYVRLVTAVNV